MLNARQTGGGIVVGPRLSAYGIKREEEWIKDFYQPLSTLPMFTPDDSVVEETL